MQCVAVLTAAGSGSRLGHALPKGLVPLAGVPLVQRAARGLAASGVVDRIVVTAPAGHLDAVAALVAEGFATDAGRLVPVSVVPGGRTRQASVAAALATLDAPAGPAVVLVHDAARALAPTDLVRRVVAAVVAGAGAVVPGLTVTDTVKQVAPTPDGGWRVVATPERSTLRAVQTPQGFDHGLLLRAHAAATERRDDEARAVSDDAGLVELLGVEVRMVVGDERALKITVPEDLDTAERWLSRS